MDVGKDLVHTSLQIPAGKGLYDMEGTVPGAAGDVRIIWQSIGGTSSTSNWIAVDAETDYSTRFNLEGLQPATKNSIRLEAKSGASFEGSFKTPPPVDEEVSVTFSVVTGSRFNLRDNKEIGHTANKSMAGLAAQ
ncbi:MAG: hypothetical protein ISS70_19570 [Phycisphaerae bacterium]|nr:hypothetical protein [Phycisphaerae bacterium]